jgi:hypothetical protein
MILSLADQLEALAGLFPLQSETLTSFRTFSLFHPPFLLWLRLCRAAPFAPFRGSLSAIALAAADTLQSIASR